MSTLRRGMTLLELTISAALLGLLMTLVCNVIATHGRAFRERDVQERAFQRAAHSLEALTRDLRSAQEVLSPSRQQLLAGFAPLEEHPLTLRGTSVRSWACETSSRELTCREFTSVEDWKAGNAARQFSLGRFPLWVQFHRVNGAPLLAVRLGLEPRLPLETQVAFPAFATSPWADR